MNLPTRSKRLPAALLTAVLGALAPALAQPPAAAPDDAPAAQRPRSVTPTPSPAVVLRGETGVVLRNLRIDDELSIDLQGCADVTVIGCDVRSIRAGDTRGLRVVNSFIHDSPRPGVALDGCEDVLVQGNRMERISSGVYAHRSRGVRVVGNFVGDVQGPMPRGQLAQFDKVSGPGNAIVGNHAVNRHGASRPEDCISLFQSTGTAESPIRVEGNFLAGDPARGSEDKSGSGSGIMLGDGGGRHQVAADNVVVDAGQVGIGVAGGGDIVVENNTILGRRSNVSNVGLYVWNQYADQPAGPVTVRGNRVHWTNARGEPNPYWEGGGFPRVTQAENAFNDAALPAAPPSPPVPAPRPPLFYGEDPEAPYPLP